MSANILTIAETSSELGVTELAVRRAVCKGSLNGQLIGTAWRITSAALGKFIDDGAPNLSPPNLESGGGWLDCQTIDRYAAGIEQTLRDRLSAIAPAEAPPQAVDGSQTTITLPLTTEMQTFLAAKPSRDPFRVPGTPELPFATNADVFAASKQSAILARLCADPKNPANGLQMLYRSPQDFKRLCDAASAQFANSFVSVSKTYRPQGSYGFGLVCSWQISCKTFGSSDVLKTLV